MSAATKIPTVMRALALIKYTECVADLIAGCALIEIARKKGKEVRQEGIAALVVLLAETDALRKDNGVEITGLNFERLRARVHEACGIGVHQK